MRRYLFWIIGIISAIALVIVVTAALTPDQTNPAFDAALVFANGVGLGDDAAALAVASPDLRDHLLAVCPDGSPSACAAAYTPPEWGGMISAVFRRAAPEGPRAWDVDLIATYERDRGFSGVCIYTRVEQDAEDQWRVVRYAGFVHCGDPASRGMAANPDAPNRTP